MGAWGKRFYENDDTCDIRDCYMALLEESDTDEKAYEELLKQMQDRLENEDDALIFWAALADTQWRIGRLREDVREEAVTRIRRSLDDPTVAQDDLPGLLRDELKEIQEKLFRPMPKKKRIMRLLTGNQDPWNLNDVYVYQFHSKASVEAGCWGKYIAIQKIGSDTMSGKKGKVAMRVHFFDRLFDSIPTISEIKKTRILPLDIPKRMNISHDAINSYGLLWKKAPIEMNSLIAAWRASAYPKKHLFYVGNMEAAPNRNNKRGSGSLSWDGIERTLIFYLDSWRNKNYIDLGDGVFDYQQDE